MYSKSLNLRQSVEALIESIESIESIEPMQALIEIKMLSAKISFRHLPQYVL